MEFVANASVIVLRQRNMINAPLVHKGKVRELYDLGEALFDRGNGSHLGIRLRLEARRAGKGQCA